MENKFKKGLEERRTVQVQPDAKKNPIDVDTFIQLAASDGALTRNADEPVLVHPEPVKAPISPMERLIAQLSAHKEDVLSKGKGKAERITISFPKEQLIKAEIIKLLLESEKEMPLAMSQVISILIDRGFDSMMKE